MDVEERLSTYRSLADQYAVAKAQRGYLEDYKKSLLAMLMKDAERKKVVSVAGQERDALCRDEYAELIKGLQTAVHDEEKLRFHLKAVEWEIEIWRTKEASQRAERRAYGA